MELGLGCMGGGGGLGFLVVCKAFVLLAMLEEFLVPSTVFLGTHEGPRTSKDRAKLLLVV